jgi:hypothetical protein
VLHGVDGGHREALVDLEPGSISLSMYASEGEPWPRSVSTRSSVPPGTFASAAAWTFAATPATSGCSC